MTSSRARSPRHRSLRFPARRVLRVGLAFVAIAAVGLSACRELYDLRSDAFFERESVMQIRTAGRLARSYYYNKGFSEIGSRFMALQVIAVFPEIDPNSGSEAATGNRALNALGCVLDATQPLLDPERRAAIERLAMERTYLVDRALFYASTYGYDLLKEPDMTVKRWHPEIFIDWQNDRKLFAAMRENRETITLRGIGDTCRGRAEDDANLERAVARLNEVGETIPPR